MSAKIDRQEIFLDCGENDHFVPEISAFKTYKDLPPPIVETTAGTGKLWEKYL